MKPKSKSSRRIALGRRGRQRSAGQARGAGGEERSAGPGSQRSASLLAGAAPLRPPGVSEGGRRSGLFAKRRSNAFPLLRAGGGGEDLQQLQLESEEGRWV